MEIFTQDIQSDQDILAARDRSRVICEELGFAIPQQLQVTTSVFELGKNILEHAGSGSISISLFTEEDSLTLQIEGTDEGPGMEEDTIRELLETKTSTKSLRGIPAMRRLMDSVEIESESGRGTVIRMTKKRGEPPKSFTKNLVGFIQEKFSARKKPSLQEELNLQNANLVQTLSLYEDKNQELRESNQELLELKKQLEENNAELSGRSAELQEALLSLGDRTAELESQNRRFYAILRVMPEGVAFTNRSGVVTNVNERLCGMFGAEPDDLVSMKSIDWRIFLSAFKTVPEDAWNKKFTEMDSRKDECFDLTLRPPGGGETQCRVIPILGEGNKFHGRIWIVDPPGTGMESGRSDIS